MIYKILDINISASRSTTFRNW